MTASVEPELPSTGHGKVLRLPPDVHRLRDARRFVCETLAEWEAAPPQDAALMTTELVSNAMLHAGGDVAVRVRRDGARALVEVHDKSPERPQVQPVDPHRSGGNGLRIVDALASDWGVSEIHDDGKVVWFEVPLPT